jgi:hypothetical protein
MGSTTTFGSGIYQFSFPITAKTPIGLYNNLGSGVAFDISAAVAYSIAANSLNASTSIFSGGGNDISWDGKRWIAVGDGAANRVATSYDGITWSGVATSTNLFTSYAYGISSNYNASSNQLILSNTTGQTVSNRLEIVADSYYNQGPTELSVSITSNNL